MASWHPREEIVTFMGSTEGLANGQGDRYNYPVTRPGESTG